MSDQNYRFETRAIHAGTAPDPTTGAVQTPIYQTASYQFKSIEHAANLFNLKEMGNVYSRLTNPTISALQDRLASLEGGVGGVCTASGLAANLTGFFNLMQSGDSFIASKRLYGGTVNQLSRSFKQFGWECIFVDMDDLDSIKAAIKPNTKLVFAEGLANPGGVVTDIQAVADIAHNAGIPLIIDNTMATPYLCQPIEHGADMIVHSTTKFLSGNGSSMGGVLIDSGNFDWNQNDKFPLMTQPDPSYNGIEYVKQFGKMAFTVRSIAMGLRDLGANQSPMNAFLTLLGTESLHVRMDRHVENATKVAQFLEGHKQVSYVTYAGLPSSKYHDLAMKYLPKGAGAVFTIGVEGGYEIGKKVVESCKLFHHLANIGDSRSLLIHPASTTHSQLSDEHKTLAGAGPEVIRISIGLEHADDIIADLDQALHAANSGSAKAA